MAAREPGESSPGQDDSAWGSAPAPGLCPSPGSAGAADFRDYLRLHLVTPNPPPRAGETEASPGASPPGPADWEDPLLRALPREARVPLVWGSSGGSGASPPLPDSSLTSRQIQAENLRAAASRLADVDQAAGMTALTRDYIVAQAAVGMLAQANSLPRLALSLVGA